MADSGSQPPGLEKAQTEQVVSEDQLRGMAEVLDREIQGAGVSAQLKKDLLWMAARVRSRCPRDLVRIASRVRGFEEVRGLRDSAWAQFESASDSAANGVLKFSRGFSELPDRERRLIVAHEFGHAAAFDHEMLSRLPQNYSPKWWGVVAEVVANMHVYRWGLGKLVQERHWESPGRFVTIGRVRYVITSSWTLKPA